MRSLRALGRVRQLTLDEALAELAAENAKLADAERVVREREERVRAAASALDLGRRGETAVVVSEQRLRHAYLTRLRAELRTTQAQVREAQAIEARAREATECALRSVAAARAAREVVERKIDALRNQERALSLAADELAADELVAFRAAKRNV